MKKLLFVLLALAVLFASCSNSSDGSAGLGLLAMGGGSRGENTDADPVLIGASNLVYIGEGTENVNSTQYKVKKYADVLVDNPYFYTYYKLYYLNGKLRRVYQFDHGIGSEMDYKYTEFVEHNCTGSNFPIIFTYYENGKLESRANYQYTLSAEYVPTKTFYEYNSAGNKKLEKRYQNNTLNYECYYYSNGRQKFLVYFNSDETLSYFDCYYESGYLKYHCGSVTSYEGIIEKYIFYSYDDGKTKSNSNNPSVYSSKEDLTPEQARAKLEQLKNN